LLVWHGGGNCECGCDSTAASFTSDIHVDLHPDLCPKIRCVAWPGMCRRSSSACRVRVAKGVGRKQPVRGPLGDGRGGILGGLGEGANRHRPRLPDVQRPASCAVARRVVDGIDQPPESASSPDGQVATAGPTLDPESMDPLATWWTYGEPNVTQHMVTTPEVGAGVAAAPGRVGVAVARTPPPPVPLPDSVPPPGCVSLFVP